MNEYLNKNTLKARIKKLENEMIKLHKSISNFETALNLAKDPDNINNLTERLDEKYKLKRLKQNQLDSLLKEKQDVIEFNWETEFKKVANLNWDDKAELRRFLEKVIVKIIVSPMKNGNCLVGGVLNIFGQRQKLDIKPLWISMKGLTEKEKELTELSRLIDEYKDIDFEKNIVDFMIEYKTKYINSNRNNNLMTD